ncbi:MAG: peroxidase-related enzyme [Euryarchaeota archaeon]|nr:peroxidase-related enzyme [Euryarchaeota archaeon]
MARIQVIDEGGAQGLLKDVYAEVAGARGSVANVFKIESLNAAVMRAHLNFYMSIMYGKSGLSRQQREMVAVTVSNANGCAYCTTHHTEALSKYLKDEEALRAIKTDYGTAPIRLKEKAMLAYALKVTKSPAAVSDADVAKLREVGFSEADILDITFVASYFNFVNRLVLSLGVDLETPERRVYRY